ncbi:Diuretic hormone 44 receptor 1 [Carabus blaptoides fortunei]
MDELTVDISPTVAESSNFFSEFNLTREQTIQLISHLNGSMSEYAKCLMDNFVPTIVGGCKSDFDGLLCWNGTEANTLSVLPCVPEIKGIKYNTSYSVSRWCHGNGTWNITDYTECREVHPMVIPQSAEITTTIYFVGYISSLLALIIAMWIFLYFKDLRCLRNVIHTNLMCTYILTDLFWILTLTLQIFADINLATCVFLITFLNYFILTNFFWMFVEGLYLYMLVVQTFTGENITLRVYATIGWGKSFEILFIYIKKAMN